MLGKNTSTYKNWVTEQQRYKAMPKALDVINLGSSCDANNFDYSLWNIDGFNFASAPQDVYYDNQLLEQYGERVRPGGIVFISLSEFALLVDKYDIEDHNYKYYWYLDSERIVNYTNKKKWMLYKCPGLLDKKYLKQEIKQFAKKALRYNSRNRLNADIAVQSKVMLQNWFHEFGWDERCVLRDEQKRAIGRSWNLIQKDVAFCNEHGLIPIIIIPPFAKELIEILPKDILDECLWKYIDILKQQGIQVINFWEDEELLEKTHYSTPITLNDSGIKIFNQKLKGIVVEKLDVSDMESAPSKRSYKSDKKQYYLLENRMKVPCIAFGTGVIKRFYRNKKMYFLDNAKDILRSIKHHKVVRRLKNDLAINDTLKRAIDNGYRMFDSGRLYGHSEKAIGDAVSKHNREEFFLITKISEDDLKRYPDAATVHDNLTLSLKFLQTNYIDAYLLHFPSGDYISMYKEIEKEYELGRAKSIGVCNFDIEELKELINNVEIKPMVCQVEMNPLNTKKELREFCLANHITMMAHTPTGHMDKRIVDSDIIKELKEKYHKSAAQIIYRWHYQNLVIPIVSSISDTHMRENLDIFDFELDPEELAGIDKLDQGFSFDKYNNKVSDCPDFIYNL